MGEGDGPLELSVVSATWAYFVIVMSPSVHEPAYSAPSGPKSIATVSGGNPDGSILATPSGVPAPSFSSLTHESMTVEMFRQAAPRSPPREVADRAGIDPKLPSTHGNVAMVAPGLTIVPSGATAERRKSISAGSNPRQGGLMLLRPSCHAANAVPSPPTTRFKTLKLLA